MDEHEILEQRYRFFVEKGVTIAMEQDRVFVTIFTAIIAGLLALVVYDKVGFWSGTLFLIADSMAVMGLAFLPAAHGLHFQSHARVRSPFRRGKVCSQRAGGHRTHRACCQAVASPDARSIRKPTGLPVPLRVSRGYRFSNRALASREGDGADIRGLCGSSLDSRNDNSAPATLTGTSKAK